MKSSEELKKLKTNGQRSIQFEITDVTFEVVILQINNKKLFEIEQSQNLKIRGDEIFERNNVERLFL